MSDWGGLRAAWGVTVVGGVLALSACTGNAPDPLDDSASELIGTAVEEAAPDVTVQQRDFKIDYVLEAATETGKPVTLTLASGLEWDEKADAAAVSEGDTIGRQSIATAFRDHMSGPDATRTDAAALAVAEGQEGAYRAPVDGDLTWDGDVAVVSGSGLDVTTALSPLQQLRLSHIPLMGTATVETIVGERTVACEAVWITAPVEGGGDESAVVRCKLPSVVETAPGLRATLRIESDTIADAILVPNSMLGTDAGGYTVTVITAEGEQTHPVTVGMSDGVMRVITSPLPVGATIVPPAAS